MPCFLYMSQQGQCAVLLVAAKYACQSACIAKGICCYAGIYGAAEGVSYLVVLGVVGWSLYTKVKTGSGLPAGPSGLLGAIEGTSFLTLLVSIGVFGLQILQKGSLPGITG